ncbi:hypothetical protein ASG17_01995 [Brevundimonas sp. Leaf363]|uniref:hypothetical protein n=1 Tax=Brevundimonas sp. Leaf363 TaxID=1736353 RepID=UPI000701DC8F|nr:hypothetical protein [Brevundimonas sp. Leaf363]KQS57512.1 hypothetical protein ASG17_01995 [Brevundimonas sp. Leaf363]
MRLANILALVSATIWFGLFLVGHNLIGSLADQHITGFPNSGQVQMYVWWPAAVGLVVFATVCLCNGLKRWRWLLKSVAALSLLMLGPFLLAYSGGI